jgi:O-methyltransferase involved in polyketide biosynthesis
LQSSESLLLIPVSENSLYLQRLIPHHMNVKERVQLKDEKETLFITLYAKAQDYQSNHSILHDHWADDMMRSVNYDFTHIAKFSNTVSVVRAKQFDEFVESFIRAHHNAVIVYLGCGLDARIMRIAPPPMVSWFDVDYPEVIALRKDLFPSRDGYHMIPSSVTEAGWLDQIPGNRPTLILAEGLVEYLTEEKVQVLLNRLTDHFRKGQIIFDVMNSFAIKLVKDKLQSFMGASPSWAVDDVQRVDRLNPRLKRINSLSIASSRYIKRLPFKTRLSLTVFSIFPAFRHMLRILQYEF